MNGILRSVRNIEIRTRYLVEGLLQGAYHSVFKGRGIEFSEVREYCIGDDIRTIDWNVTARMNHPYVKEFIEERDLTVYIVLDVSASSNFGSSKEKRLAAAEIAASLMFSAVKNNDNIGLFLFTTEVERYIPARKGKRHALKLIREMISYTPDKKGTDIGTTLSRISRMLKKRSIIFIMSDFIGRNEEKPLRLLKRRHDVKAIDLHDEREMEIPDVGYIELMDEETGDTVMINTSDEEFRKEYMRLARKRKESLSRLFRSCRIDMIPIMADEAFEVPLRRFFHERVRRIR